MTDKTEALPPLPEPDCRFPMDGPPRFRADQMRGYARAALAQRQQVPEANSWRSLLIGGFVQKWSGNDLVKAGDVLDWIMDQPISAAPALTAAPSAQAEPVAWRHPSGSLAGPKQREAWGDEAMAIHGWEPLYAAPPAAQAEPQMVAPQDGMEFWLWKNGDHFLAFTHLYPCFTPGGDPMVLGEPVGRAVFRRSFHRSSRGNAIGPAQPELPKARSLTDELMDCVDRLGSEAKDVDPRVWDHLRVYMPAPQAAQAEPQEPPAQQQSARPEPVAQIHDFLDGDYGVVRWLLHTGEPLNLGDKLYATQPRAVEPLTPLEAIGLWKDRSDGPSNAEIVSYCRAIERAHGIGKT